MGILIKGMDEIPEDGSMLVVRHDDNGKAYIKYARTYGYSMELVKQPTKKYVIEKVGYTSIVVSITEQEASVIERFLKWAEVDDDFCITPVEEYEGLDWGGG